jgi:hypothetical protein
VVCDVILHRGAVANRVHLAQWSADKSEMRVGFQGTTIVLSLNLLRNLLAELRLC